MMPRGGLRSKARTRHRRANAGADAQKAAYSKRQMANSVWPMARTEIREKAVKSNR
jgi:hypothetical protein